AACRFDIAPGPTGRRRPTCDPAHAAHAALRRLGRLRRPTPPYAALRRLRRLRGEALHCARVTLGCLDLTVLRRGCAHEIVEQPSSSERDLADSAVKRGGVRGRRLRRAADLADVLKGGVLDLLVAGGRGEGGKHPYIAAHGAA